MIYVSKQVVTRVNRYVGGVRGRYDCYVPMKNANLFQSRISQTPVSFVSQQQFFLLFVIEEANHVLNDP